MSNSDKTHRQKTERRNLLRLSAREGSANLTRLHKDLKKMLARKTTVSLDGAEVSRIETTSLQLILSFWRERREKNRTTEWQAISEELGKTIHLHGMQSSLEVRSDGEVPSS